MVTLTPVRNNVENLAKLPGLRDVFLCHAWDDRQGAAKELHDLLESLGVRVWFSEKDVGLGVPLLHAIDKGLANSRVGIVLVTPALLRRLPAEGTWSACCVSVTVDRALALTGTGLTAWSSSCWPKAENGTGF